MKPLRRALILTPTHARFGGVEAIVNALARELPSRGWEVQLGLLQGARFNRPEAFPRDAGVATIEIDGTTGTSEGRIRALVQSIEASAPDLVLAARVADGFEAMRRVKRKTPECRFALTIQAYESDYLWDLARWAGQVDFCVTSGELVRRACEEVCGIESSRLASIPGGVRAPAAFAPRDFEKLLRIGYAGRLEQPQKRIGDLVEIAVELRRRGLSFSLDIAGTGPEEERVVSRLRATLGSAFRFHGWIGDAHGLGMFYSKLDVFLHTAAHEGVTIAPREAMAWGVVPVVSEFPGFWTEHHFQPGVNASSFPMGDVLAAAEAIEALDRDRKLLAALSEGALRSQSGIYSWSGALDAWASAFEACMEMPSCPPLARPRSCGKTDTGRLARLGIPAGLAQTLRDLMGRKTLHVSGGDEWPHAGPPPPMEFENRLSEFALCCEEEARHQWTQNKNCCP